MLYKPGTYLGNAVQSAIVVTDWETQIEKDTEDILNSYDFNLLSATGELMVFGENLSIQRRTVTYDASGMKIETWALVTSFIGDWQPASGSTIRREAGMNLKSDAQVLTVTGVDVAEGDRLYKSDGTFEYVNYVQKYEDHYTIYLRKVQGNL